MSDEPPPPGAEDSEPPVPGVDDPTAAVTDPAADAYAAHSSAYAAQAAYGTYPAAAGYTDYYNYYYPGYTPAAGYGQYGYDYNYAATAAAADPYASSTAADPAASSAANVAAAAVAAATAAAAATAPAAPGAAPPPPDKKKEAAPVQVIPLPESTSTTPPPPSDPVSPPPIAPPAAEPTPAATAPASTAPSSLPGPTQETLSELQQRMQELMEKQKQEQTPKTTIPLRKPGIAVPTLRGAKLAIGAPAATKQASQQLFDKTDTASDFPNTTSAPITKPGAAITTPTSVPNMSATTAGPKGLTISAPSTLTTRTDPLRKSPAHSPIRRSRRSPSPGDRGRNSDAPPRARSPPDWKGRTYRRRRDDSPDGLPGPRDREAELALRRREDTARPSPSFDTRDRSLSPAPYRRRRSVSPGSPDYKRRGSGSPPNHREVSGSPRGGYYRGRGRGGGYREEYREDWRGEDGYYRGRGRMPYRGRSRGYYPRRGRGRFSGYHDRYESYDPDDRYDPERSYSDDRYETEERYTPDDGGYRGRGRGMYEPRGRGRGYGRGGYDDRYDPGFARGRGRRFDPRHESFPDERPPARPARPAESYSSPASSDQDSEKQSESSSPSPSPSPSPPPRPPPAAKPAPKPAYNFEDEFADIDRIDFSVLGAGGKATSTVSEPKPAVSGGAPAAAIRAGPAAMAANGTAVLAAVLPSAPSVTASSAERRPGFEGVVAGKAETGVVTKGNGTGSLFPVTEWVSAVTSKGKAGRDRGESVTKRSKEEMGSPIYGDGGSAGSGSDVEVAKKHKKKHKKHKKKHKKHKRGDAMEDDEAPDTEDRDGKRDKKRKRPPPYFQHDDRDATPPAAAARPEDRWEAGADRKPPKEAPVERRVAEEEPDYHANKRFRRGGYSGGPGGYQEDEGYQGGYNARGGGGYRGRGRGGGHYEDRFYDDRPRRPDAHLTDEDDYRGYRGRGRFRGRGEPRGRSSYRGRGDFRRSYNRYSRSRSRSRSYSGRSGSRSPSRSQSRSKTPPHRGRRSPSPLPYQNRSISRSRSPRREVKNDPRTKEEVAVELAKAAEAARMAALQVNTGTQLQYTRHARRIYVGGLPVGTSEVELTQFFNSIMMAAGACTAPGAPISSCYMNPEKRFAFLEFRSVEETSNAMAFDGVTCKGETLKIRRPHDYDPQAAKLLGPVAPSSGLNLALMGIVNSLVEDGPNKMIVENLPPSFTEAQFRDLVQAWGSLKSVSLPLEESGQIKGHGYCEFLDSSVIETAIQGLASLPIAGRTLVARRANSDENDTLKRLIEQQQHKLLSKAGMAPPTSAPSLAGLFGTSSGGPVPVKAEMKPKVVRLSNMVERDELLDSEDYGEILEDTRDEVRKYGPLKSVFIPRPAQDTKDDPPGVGLVFLEYEDHAAAEKARKALHGRTFGTNTVEARFFDQAKYDAKDLS